MGNCIGKKSSIYYEQRRHSSATINTSTKLYYNDQRPTKQASSLALASLATLNTSSERSSILLSHMSDAKEINMVFNDNDESKRKVIQYSSSSLLPTMTPSTNEQFVFMRTSSPTLSPVQLSSECCKKIKSSNTVTVLGENNIKQPLALTTNEQDMTIGHLFSKKKDINKENDKEKMTINIEIHMPDEDQNKSHQYFTIINDEKPSNNETMIDTQEIIQESLDTSRSPSLFDSSLSSLSCNTTPFSSQDRLILSSSPSSSSSAILSSIGSTAVIPIPPCSRSTKINQNGSRSLTYSEQIYLNNQLSYLFPTNEVFTTVLPTSSSRHHNDLFINEFHQNIISHNCKILSTVIDNVVQQQFIRIHQCSKVILIEHKELECEHLKDVKKFHTPSLIFDDQQKNVYITKHAHTLGLQSVTCITNNVTRLPKLFSSCDHCSLLLSGSKLNKRLHPFILVNTTHNLVEMCFNETNNNAIFGYISQKHPTKIQQTIINNSKFAYSYDLDIGHSIFYFVLRIHSWPHELRQIYEQRQRLWPMNTDKLFDGTCFIRINTTEQNIPTINKCLACEKMLSSSSDSTWSYTYTAIEAKLVAAMSDDQIRFASIIWNYLNGKTHGELPFRIFKHTLFYFFEQYSSDCFISCDLLSHAHLDSTWSYTYTAIEAKLVAAMSDDQIRFASIIWNYLNGKTHGELPFRIFKHTLFYFFEQYSSDCFISCDLLSHAHLFTDFLFNCLQTKSIPHYFNSNYNLYTDNLSTTLMSSISIKMTYLDLKSFSIHLLPTSSLYLYQLIYLIQFQTNFLQYLLACTSSKTNSIQTILDTHELVIKQLSLGIKTYKRQLDTNIALKTHKTLTLDCLYRYQEENVQIILDYLPLLRDKEPSLLIHSLWSMFIQYFNCLFDDLFTS
ncbi:unnamed protein product [Adineta steineri]|uniref:Uncharacterized protein n=1 Tax=Adineta steineri TaxID=433720 RepID=A0A814VFW9_9BILA|nr:unnamed protein product [Adineta steineri]